MTCLLCGRSGATGFVLLDPLTRPLCEDRTACVARMRAAADPATLPIDYLVHRYRGKTT